MNEMTLTPEAEVVLKEAKKAYYDCWWVEQEYQAREKLGDSIGNHQLWTDIEKESHKKRNLSWKASRPVSPEEACKIMRIVFGLGKEPENDEGYNDFRPNILNDFPANSKIWLARENSVCVYVYAEGCDCDWFKDPAFMADEYNIDVDGQIRIWWD